MRSETPNKSNGDYSLGKRANGDKPEEVRTFLFLQKKAEKQVKSIVTPQFLKPWQILPEEVPDIQREIATIVVRSRVRFKDWNESDWMSFCREYMEYCSEKEESLIDDSVIEGVSSIERADFLEIILREQRSEVAHEKSNGQNEVDNEKIEDIDTLLRELKDRRLLLLRQKYTATPEAEGYAFYQEFSGGVEEKRRKIELVDKFRDLNAVVDSEEKVKKDNRSFTKRIILSPEKFQKYIDTASDETREWMQQEIDAANRTLGKSLSEKFRSMREKQEGIDGFFSARSEELLHDIEGADYDALMSIGHARLRGGKITTAHFIARKDIDALIERFPSDEGKIHIFFRKTEGIIRKAWNERLVFAQKENAESQVKEVENQVTLKLAWAEAEYTNPENAGKILPEQYEILQKFLHKSLSDAQSALSEGRFPRLKHIVKEVSEAEFKSLTPEPSHEQRHSSARGFGSRLRSVVIRSKSKEGDEVMDGVANKKERKKTPKQILKAFELVADGGYVDVSQRNGVDRIGKKVGGILYLGVTDDFGSLHYFPLDTFEEKIRSGWIVSLSERNDISHEMEMRRSPKAVFNALRKFFKKNEGLFQHEGDTLEISGIVDKGVSLRFELKNSLFIMQKTITQQQAIKCAETIKKTFGVDIFQKTAKLQADISSSNDAHTSGGATSVVAGNPVDQPPLPDSQLSKSTQSTNGTKSRNKPSTLPIDMDDAVRDARDRSENGQHPDQREMTAWMKRHDASGIADIPVSPDGRPELSDLLQSEPRWEEKVSVMSETFRGITEKMSVLQNLSEETKMEALKRWLIEQVEKFFQGVPLEQRGIVVELLLEKIR